MRRIIVPAVLAIGLTLTGCTTREPETVYVTTEPEPVQEPATQEPVEPEPTLSDQEIQGIALQLAWEGMTQQQKTDICWGWNNMGADWSLDQMQQSMPELDRALATDFFDGKC